MLVISFAVWMEYGGNAPLEPLERAARATAAAGSISRDLGSISRSISIILLILV